MRDMRTVFVTRCMSTRSRGHHDDGRGRQSTDELGPKAGTFEPALPPMAGGIRAALEKPPGAVRASVRDTAVGSEMVSSFT